MRRLNSQGRILILHGHVPADAPADEQDVLVEVASVRAALCRLRYDTVELALTLDLGDAAAKIKAAAPDLVFNLVESLEGNDRLIAVGPLLCDHIGIPYTGSSSAAIAITSNKITAKEIMAARAIPTPEWAGGKGVSDSLPGVGFPAIVKSALDHASIGLSGESVVHSPGELRKYVRKLPRRQRDTLFVERFIEGREFNVTVLEEPAGPRVLPPSEIRFDAFPPGKPRIVGYEAKWQTGSFEYNNTPRCFDGRRGDNALHKKLEKIALQCWDLFALRGYARVDFRIDKGGKPWVLEINANPCISPDAGLAATAEYAGIPYSKLVHKIVRAAMRRSSRAR